MTATGRRGAPPVPAGPEEEAGYAEEPWTPRWVRWSSVVLCLTGLGVDIYLTIQHYFSSAVPLVCSDKGGINCAKVLSSQWSKLFGIPMTDLGVAYFIGMLVLCSAPAWRRPERWVSWLRTLGVVVSMGMVIYLLHAELFDIRAICLYCTVTHVVAFLLFIVVLTADALRRTPTYE